LGFCKWVLERYDRGEYKDRRPQQYCKWFDLGSSEREEYNNSKHAKNIPPLFSL
jgi:hypothetical protein